MYHVSSTNGSRPPRIVKPDLELQAAEAALKRRGRAGRVVPGKVPGSWRTQYEVENGNLVSIIIPTCAAGGLIEKAISSIRTCTDYPNIEIIAIEQHPGSRSRLEDLASRQHR